MIPAQTPSPFHALALSAFSLLASASARADYQFTYTSFDAPGGSLTVPYAGSGAYGLSNSGAIVGVTSADAVTYDGYLRRANGSYTTLNYPGSVPRRLQPSIRRQQRGHRHRVL